MNLRSEQTYQLCQDLLESLHLLEENRRLANEYLDTEQPEDRKLLKNAVPQDFSNLSQEVMSKSLAYMAHLNQGKLAEDFGRYVRFCAAVGGSTARYPLYYERAAELAPLRGLDKREYLTPEQAAAILSEMTVWGPYGLYWEYNGVNSLVKLGSKEPQIYRKATALCYNSRDDAKILLAGLYLRLGNREDSHDISQMVSLLENSLISTAVSEMRINGSPLSDQKKAEVADFFHKAAPETDFTTQAPSVLQNKFVFANNLIALLPGAAFLAVERSDRCLLFVRFMLYESTNITLNACVNMCGSEWVFSHIKLLERDFPGNREEYIRWCTVNRFAPPIKRLALSDPDALKHSLSSLTAEGYLFLISQVQEVNPALYRTLGSRHEKFRNQMAQELTERYRVGNAEAASYLSGQVELSQLYPFVEEWRKGIYIQPIIYKKIARMRDGEDVAMFRRAAVLEALGNRPNFFVTNAVYPSDKKISQGDGQGTEYDYDHPIDERQLQAMLSLFEDEKLPVVYQLALLEAVHTYYDYHCTWKSNPVDKVRESLMDLYVDVLASREAAWRGDLARQAKEGPALTRLLCIRVLNTRWSENKEILLSCAGDTAKQVHKVLLEIYESHREWAPDICTMLKSKKSQDREMAVQVLDQWGAAPYGKELKEALAAEKSKKIKDKIRDLLDSMGAGEDSKAISQIHSESVEQLIIDLLKGSKRRKVEWVCQGTPVATVHQTDGEACTQDHLLAILAAYADMSEPGMNRDAARLASQLDQKELADFMGQVLDKWQQTGAEAKKKWVLYAVSIHGGENITYVIYRLIQNLPQTRKAIAAEALRALVLNGTSTALFLAAQVSRKSKNFQTRAAAGEVIANVARQRGITKDELEDSIVPDFGFDENGERQFDYGSRSFRVRLTPRMELEVFDENGKKLKNLPAPGKRDDEEKAKAAAQDFGQMKKQLKAASADQKIRLEQILSTGRLWTAEKWQELFVKNPVMHQFAIGLIWGVYALQEQKHLLSNTGEQLSGSICGTYGIKGTEGHEICLTDTFRYMEDGSFNTADEEEYELPENAMIGLVHPVELQDDILQAWKAQLSDYELTQPFEQLERPTYRVTEEEKQKKALSQFNGSTLNCYFLCQKLLDQGWFHGAVQDRGIYYTFHRCDGANGAELEFSGTSAISEEKDVTVYDVAFYPAEALVEGGYKCQADYDRKRSLLSEVSPRYFSEIVLLLTRACSS